MVIDFHTHIFNDALAPKALAALEAGCNGLYKACHDMTLGGILERMDEWGIDKSVVMPVLTKRSQFEKVNEWAISIASDRIEPFAGIYPNAGDGKEQIRIISEMGFKGIKLHPEYQDFTVDTDEMLKLYDYAFEKGLILLFHAGFDPAFSTPMHTSPQRFAHIADELPGGKLVVAHLGGQMQWDDVEKYLCGREVYLDTSMGFKYYSVGQFLRIVEKHGADRLLFATDSPWSNAGEELEIFRSLPLSAEQKEQILYKNALGLLQ